VGIYSWLRTRTDKKIEALARPLLREGEAVELGVMARTRPDVRFFLAFAAISGAIVLVMRVGWLPRLGSVAVPIAITLSVAWFIRTYYLVATADRLVVLRISRWTQRNVDAHYAVDLTDVRAALTHGRWDGTVLTVTPRPFGERLQIGPSFRERARDLVRRLSGSPDSGERPPD
jgi:hypothetical protein